MDMFEGEKTLSSAKKQMIRDGIEGSQFENREKLIELLESIKSPVEEE